MTYSYKFHIAQREVCAYLSGRLEARYVYNDRATSFMRSAFGESVLGVYTNAFGITEVTSDLSGINSDDVVIVRTGKDSWVGINGYQSEQFAMRHLEVKRL